MPSIGELTGGRKLFDLSVAGQRKMSGIEQYNMILSIYKNSTADHTREYVNILGSGIKNLFDCKELSYDKKAYIFSTFVPNNIIFEAIGKWDYKEAVKLMDCPAFEAKKISGLINEKNMYAAYGPVKKMLYGEMLFGLKNIKKISQVLDGLKSELLATYVLFADYYRPDNMELSKLKEIFAFNKGLLEKAEKLELPSKMYNMLWNVLSLTHPSESKRAFYKDEYLKEGRIVDLFLNDCSTPEYFKAKRIQSRIDESYSHNN